MKVKIAGLFLIMILFQGCISNALAKEPTFTEKDVTVTGGIIAKERTYTESGRVVLEKPGGLLSATSKRGNPQFSN
jgi:hypothetical protein